MKRLIATFLLCAVSVSAQSGTGIVKGTGNISITPLPVVSVTPPSVDFGNVPQNTTSPSTAITILNSGTTPLTITGISTSAPFAQSNNCPTVLAGLSSCTVQVTFTPNAVSAFSGTLLVADNASPATQAVNLSGTGTGSVASAVLIQGGAAQPASNYFILSGTNTAIYLAGSHAWNDLQDEDKTSAPGAVDFNAYVTFLKAHGQNATILWHKDLPTFCGWGAQGTWTIASNTGMQWQRTGPGSASDGFLKFDLTKLNQPYFDRLRARAVQLNQNGIYAVVEFFDGLGLSVNRCNSDGYPFTAINNINGIDDGYSGGASGTNSMTGSVPNAFTAIQLAYIKKVIDTLNDLPNVIWEPSEEAPAGSAGWNTYMISQILTYEATKPLQHPILYATLDVGSANDPALYNSNATAIAPAAMFSAINNCSGTGTPHCKTNIQDSDHSYFGMWNDSAQVNRNYAWKNFTNGANVVFMDPYLIFAGASNPNWTNRNKCDNNVAPASGVCTVPDTRWNNLRDNLGYMASLGNRIDLIHMSAQPALSSTGFVIANNTTVGSTFVVYAPNGGAFTVNLSAQANRILNFQWLDPTLGTYSLTSTVTGGSATQSFTPPWGSSYDAVLYINDGGLGWTDLPNTHFRSVEQTSWSHTTSLDPANVMLAWGGATYDSSRNRLIVWGGGHGDYKGNEVYALDLNANPVVPLRLNEPNQYSPDGTCRTPFQPGSTNPSSRHTYEGLLYLPTQDRMFVQGGSEIDSGCFGNDNWLLNPGSVAWTQGPGAGSWANGIPYCDYDPIHDQGLCFDDANGDLWVYNPVANTMSSKSPAHGSFPGDAMSAVVDYDSKRFYLVGGGFLGYFDISGSAPYPGRVDITNSTGCATFMAGHHPGVQYDPVLKALVEWHGGNSVNTYDPVANSCGSITFPNGPGAQIATGTNGRFKYIPKMGVYVLCNGWDVDCLLLRISTPADTSWAYRRTRSGVLNAQQLASAPIFSAAVSQVNRTDGFTQVSHPNVTLDTSTHLSGTGSAKFFIPAGSGENGPGSNFWMFFGQGVSGTQSFGQNSTFYVQYAFRADAAWVNTNWTTFGPNGSNTAPKLSIFHNVGAGSCAQEEITTHDHNSFDMPTSYTECGARALYTDSGGINYNESGSTFLFQQGFTDPSPTTGYDCMYNNGAKPVAPNCFNFLANQWYTLYFKVTVGTWGQPNSTIEAYIAPYGQQPKKWLNVHNYILNTDNNCDSGGNGGGALPCPGYNTMELTQFMTGKGQGSQNNSPDANVWYTEAIISSKPIPAP